MIAINKDEAKYIRDHGRAHDVHMSSMQKKSRGKKYWLTTNPKSMRLLEEFHSATKYTVYDGR